MTYSPMNESAFNDTKLRSSRVTPNSGMCSFCTAGCPGTCETGLAAVLGAAAVYPTNTGNNQIASEKDNPLNFSIFNINGRCFGARGVREGRQAEIFGVDLSRVIDGTNPIKLDIPFTLPALIKLNWQDYFAAAAMAGTVCVIGEGSPSKDPNAEKTNGKITRFEMLNTILDSFRRYYRGSGQIVLQCNTDDDTAGLPEYALSKCGCEAIEFKFGQSAKGTQPANRLKSLDEAIARKRGGAAVWPDPDDPAVAEAARQGRSPMFWSYAHLPMWTEEYLIKRIADVRSMGAKNIYFKTAGFDKRDLERVLRLASEAGVDMVTFDGAGGGSGYSPNKMMNEFGLPAVCIESAILPVCRQMESEGRRVPFITITGAISSEDQAFKALAIGAPYVKAVGLCRSTMSAAMVGETIGRQLADGKVPEHLKKFGSSKEELFLELGALRSLYGAEADKMSTGAVGAYSYLMKMTFGIQHFAALNRKFNMDEISQEDVIPLTQDARMLLRGELF